jgi:site-specific DNA-cytosine methylase
MRVASLFSGCGGLDHGLQLAGHEVVLLCESDPGAQQVTAQASSCTDQNTSC